MLRRVSRTMLAGCVVLLGAIALFVPLTSAIVPSAGAQTTTTAAGYPPPAGVIVVVNGSTITIPIGSTVTVKMGGFPPGATVTVSVNGTVVATLTADSSGAVTFTITVTDPHISINGGPAVAIPSGPNTITLSGGGVTQAFTVVVPASTTPTTASTGASSGTSSGSSGSGTLAFTGADIAATVVGGMALLAVGTVLVIVTRRRGSRAAS